MSRAAGPTVLHVTPFAALSGANRAMLTLLDGLAATGGGPTDSPAPRHALFALAESPVTAAARARGVAVHTAGKVGGAALGRARIVLALRRAIGATGAALVHSHSARAMRYCAPAAWLARGVPVVCHQRDNYAADRFHVGLGRARHLIAVSEQVRGTLPPALRGRASTVLDAVDVPAAVMPPSGSPGRVRVGAAGRCVPEKGFDLLIEAVGRLAREDATAGDQVEVEVWGVPSAGDAAEDGYARSLRSAVAALPTGLRGRVALRPFAADVGAFYDGVDVVVVPSRFAEPLGLVAREAMARARAVLVAGHGGLVESVDDGRTGLAFAPGDATALAARLRRLIADPALRDRLAAAGRAEARAHFTPAAQASAIRRLYREVFNL